MKHPGQFAAGVVFVLLGLVFLLESVGVWSFSLRDLWLLGPLILIVLGGVIVINTLTRSRGPSE
ncbi:MAG TPA: hypothetical protein VIL12_05585 [Acidimicrobiia bacterium]